ncbi:hypothetical protein EGW08_023815 [Elysia chlorotica]|uniref:Uncharacterized protein n=1 Tax=Elysia chlorotica TaxID=188477 RepID=A0A433SI49_ELYCH|nr:hypothetical protein EGW08_023815 [Elysia chlorotica]
MTFVDFQKAFDSVDREVIWKLMQYYGIPHKFINIIRRLYENSTCQVIHDGKLTDPFKVETVMKVETGPPTDITRQSLEWNPQGKRKVGRPKQTWRRSMEAEIRSAGKTWTELKRDAQNRVRWRGVALALCSSGDPEA